MSETMRRNMTFWLCFVLLCVAAVEFFVFTSGCSAEMKEEPTPAGKAISINVEFELSKAQIAALKVASMNGNGDAAYKLYQYYIFCAPTETDDAMSWLRVAVSNGCQAAKQEIKSIE